MQSLLNRSAMFALSRLLLPVRAAMAAVTSPALAQDRDPPCCSDSQFLSHNQESFK